MSASELDLFAGIPSPAHGYLIVYVFGPGVGECQVISLPDGKWMVVDCCKLGDVTLPLALLRHFGVSAIDLLVVTHPDRDHYRGLDELIGGVCVKHLWRYRGFQTRREALAELCAQQPGNTKFRDLLRAQEAMLPLLETNQGFEAAIDMVPWPGGSSSYEVICLAPCSADIVHECRELHNLLKLTSAGVRFDERVERFILGQRNGVDGRGNPLSLALSIRWQGVGVLLGGDVECSEGDPHRGWSGVLETLALPHLNRLHLVRGLQMVKVAHHGSKGAFSHDAWAHHASGGAVDVAVMTPFKGNDQQPPHIETFRALRGFARSVVLTAEPSSTSRWDRVTAEGWTPEPSTGSSGDGAWVAVSFDGVSAPSVTLGRGGAAFTPAAVTA